MDPAWNDTLLRAVNSFARETSWLHGVATAYAAGGVLLLGAVLLVALWQSRHERTPALARAGWACLAPLVAVLANQPLVAWFHQPRPYAVHPGLLVLASPTTDPAFPSDHATAAGAAIVGAYLASRTLGRVALGAGLLLAASRVYIAAHHPLDVLAGLALGAAVAWLGWQWFRAPLVRLTSWLRDQRPFQDVFARG